MAKIKLYPKAIKFDEGDVFLKDGPNGTMQIAVNDVLREFSSDIGDETLSMADKLAPAKKVGDELTELGDRIDAIIRDMCEEDSRIASKDYSVGDYIIVDDVLYKVAKGISEGDDIFENDRVVAINIMREIRRLELRINAIIRDIGEEASSVASKSYDVNDYLVLNDVLYKVAKPISIGDDILEEDRVAAINLTTEVKRLEGRINAVVRDLSEESGAVASKAYAPGEYIIIKDILYKVVKPIARNDNILENDRVEAISVMGEIESVYGRINKIVRDIGEEDTSTATRVYNAGDYIVVDDVLYKVVKPIAIGDDILENGRTVVITITGEVKRLEGRINAIIADICDEVSPIATEDYDIGDYLVLGDKFYRVVKAIAEGEAILEENRVVETTVADELKSLVERDYDIHIINRPKIDNNLLEANNNTHEELELISERDFVSEYSGKTDGMEFVLPEGTPDNPIELTEIDDSDEMKYAENLTSSNYRINSEFDAIRLLLNKKISAVVVNALPETPADNTLYIIPGNYEVDPVVPNAFYLSKGNSLYSIGGGSGSSDYVSLIDKPKIDNNVLNANNNTHEELELISERDFVTEFSGKTDGIEIVLPQGTPSSPIEISEIDDSDELKYSNRHTSSNYHINMTFDELRRLIEGKIQMRVVSELPEHPTQNSIYLVGPVEGSYTKYIVDSLGQVYNVGSDDVDLDDYVKKTIKIGSNTLENDVTVSELLDDIRAAKKIDLSYFKENTALTEMPETPTDTTVLTSKAVKDTLDNKQDVIEDKGIYYDITDTTWITGIYKESGKLCRKSMQLIKLWGWLVQSCCSETIPGPNNVPNLEVPTSQAIIDYITTVIKGTRATGNSAFTYNTSASQGYTINGDYDTNCPRQISKVGRRVNLSFCCKGSAVANSANWTSLGTVPKGYRPAKKTSIVAQVYSGTQNEAAGGYIDTSGWIVIWTNAKVATNNYQVRVNACWDVE